MLTFSSYGFTDLSKLNNLGNSSLISQVISKYDYFFLKSNSSDFFSPTVYSSNNRIIYDSLTKNNKQKIFGTVYIDADYDYDTTVAKINNWKKIGCNGIYIFGCEPTYISIEKFSALVLYCESKSMNVAIFCFDTTKLNRVTFKKPFTFVAESCGVETTQVTAGDIITYPTSYSVVETTENRIAYYRQLKELFACEIFLGATVNLNYAELTDLTVTYKNYTPVHINHFYTMIEELAEICSFDGAGINPYIFPAEHNALNVNKVAPITVNHFIKTNFINDTPLFSSGIFKRGDLYVNLSIGECSRDRGQSWSNNNPVEYIYLWNNKYGATPFPSQPPLPESDKVVIFSKNDGIYFYNSLGEVARVSSSTEGTTTPQSVSLTDFSLNNEIKSSTATIPQVDSYNIALRALSRTLAQALRDPDQTLPSDFLDLLKAYLEITAVVQGELTVDPEEQVNTDTETEINLVKPFVNAVATGSTVVLVWTSQASLTGVTYTVERIKIAIGDVSVNDPPTSDDWDGNNSIAETLASNTPSTNLTDTTAEPDTFGGITYDSYYWYRVTKTHTSGVVKSEPIKVIVSSTANASNAITGIDANVQEFRQLLARQQARRNESQRARSIEAVIAPTFNISTLRGEKALESQINEDGSADISVEWVYNSNDEIMIDGFEIILFVSSTPEPYTFTTGTRDIPLEQVFQVPATKRTLLFKNASGNKYYSFAVRGFRTLDTDFARLTSSNKLYSALCVLGVVEANDIPYCPNEHPNFIGYASGVANEVFEDGGSPIPLSDEHKPVASCLSNGNIRLTWDKFEDTISGVCGYNIWRHTGNAAEKLLIGTAPHYTDSSVAETFTDSSAEHNTTYYYSVTAFDNNNNESAFYVANPLVIGSGWISVLSINSVAPDAPTNIVISGITNHNGGLYGSWTPSTGAAYYKVELSINNGSSWNTLLYTIYNYFYQNNIISTSSFVSNNYRYKITPISKVGTLGSASSSITPDISNFFPVTTQSVSALSISAEDTDGAGVLNVAWGTGSSTVTRYTVYKTNPNLLGGNRCVYEYLTGTSLVDREVKPSISYSYEVTYERLISGSTYWESTISSPAAASINITSDFGSPEFIIQQPKLGSLFVSWSSLSQAKYYNVYRSNSELFTTSEKVSSTTMTEYKDMSPLYNTSSTWYYAITYVDIEGNEGTKSSSSKRLSSLIPQTARETQAPIRSFKPTVQANSDGSIQVQWGTGGASFFSDSGLSQGSGLRSYKIHKIVEGQVFNQKVVVSTTDDLSQLSFVDVNVEHGKTYYYEVSAVDNAGNESLIENSIENWPSATSSYAVPAGTVSGISSIALKAIVTTRWNAHSQAHHYNVYKNGTLYRRMKNTYFKDYTTSADPSVNLYYNISAVNKYDQESTLSANIIPDDSSYTEYTSITPGMPGATYPNGPQTVVDGMAIRLSWKRSDPYDSEITAYRVYRYKKEDPIVSPENLSASDFLIVSETTPVTSLSSAFSQVFVDSDIEYGYNYIYKISAVNKYGKESDFTDYSSVVRGVVYTSPSPPVLQAVAGFGCVDLMFLSSGEDKTSYQLYRVTGEKTQTEFAISSPVLIATVFAEKANTIIKYFDTVNMGLRSKYTYALQALDRSGGIVGTYGGVKSCDTVSNSFSGTLERIGVDGDSEDVPVQILTGWKYPGTVTMDGGVIQAETVKAASVSVGEWFSEPTENLTAFYSFDSLNEQAPQNGLMARFTRFEGIPSAVDDDDNFGHMLAFANASIGTGVRGEALQLTGVSGSYVDSNSFSLTMFSLSFYLKFTNFSTFTQDTRIMKGYFDANVSFFLTRTETGLSFSVQNSQNVTVSTSYSNGFENDKNYFVLMWYDGTAIGMSVGKELQSLINCTSVAQTGNLKTAATKLRFEGLSLVPSAITISEIVLYNRKLEAGEISALYGISSIVMDNSGNRKYGYAEFSKLVSGKSGKALKIYNNGKITIDNLPTTFEDCLITFWCKITAATDDDVLLKLHSTNSYPLISMKKSNKICVEMNSAGYIWTSTASMSTAYSGAHLFAIRVWNNPAGLAGNKITVWVDGTKITGTETYTNTMATINSWIVLTHQDYIEELRIYSKETGLLDTEDVLTQQIRWLYSHPSGKASYTSISGEGIQTGKIMSTNWGNNDGTLMDLDGGKIYVGGSNSPKLSWDGETLTVNGVVNVTGGNAATTENIADLEQKINDETSKIFYVQPTVPYKQGDLWVNDGILYQSTVTREIGLFTNDDWIWCIRSNFTIVIESSMGDKYKPGQYYSTLLTAHVFKNAIDIGLDLSASQFFWRRSSLFPRDYPDDDSTWDLAHSGAGRQISISNDDVYKQTTFFCDIKELI